MERDRSTLEEQYAAFEKLSKRAVESLGRRGIEAEFVPGAPEALARVMELVPEGATVGTADSATLLQVGVFAALKKRGRNAIRNPFLRDEEGRFRFSEEERQEIMRSVFLSDVYLIGTNAVTLDGKLVNIDAYGNRVAAMLFGPRKVVIVAGANKIVRNVEEAINRVRNVCAPRNVIRHVTKHRAAWYADLPCARTGTCADCTHPWRICNYTTIIEGVRQSERGRLHVVLAGEALGI